MASLAFPISRLVDPIFVLLIAAGVGLWLAGGVRRGRTRAMRAGSAIAWGALLALWLLSTPWIATELSRQVSVVPRDLQADLAQTPVERRALVVLSAGMDHDELGVPAMERVSAVGLERCVGAARIYRTYGFGRVIVSGTDSALPPAELAGGMADLLVALGVPRDRITLETESLDTKENALFSTRILRGLAIDKVVVVTSADHMRRAVRLFERAGLPVLPAPVKLPPPPERRLEELVPESISLRRSQRAVHEILGLLEP